VQPRYVNLIVPSSGVTSPPAVSAWQLIDWNTNLPTTIGLQLNTSNGIAAGIQVTLDDPTGTFLNPTVTSTGPVSVTFLSSQVQGGGIPVGTAPAVGWITSPIAALRLVSTSTATGIGTVTLTFIQQGVG
jgi:hypothetical protein